MSYARWNRDEFDPDLLVRKLDGLRAPDDGSGGVVFEGDLFFDDVVSVLERATVFAEPIPERDQRRIVGRALFSARSGPLTAGSLIGEINRGAKEFKFVDPDGLLAEPAYDLGILMRECSEELLGGDAARLGRERCAHLARLTDVDPRAIWEWGFVERVSTALLVTQVGAEELGREMLDVAEGWATS